MRISGPTWPRTRTAANTRWWATSTTGAAAWPVRDWRGVVRVANLPVKDLGKRKGQNGFIDLQKLTIEAKNRMPQHLRQKAVWYANADVLTALELQNSDAGNVQLQYGEFFDAKGRSRAARAPRAPVRRRAFRRKRGVRPLSRSIPPHEHKELSWPSSTAMPSFSKAR